jgi:hypothetical protein
MHRVRGIDPSMGELIVRVGLSLPRPARTRGLARVGIPVPGRIGHFVQLGLQRAKGRVLKLIKKAPLEFILA